MPLMAMAPALFATGVAFAYLIILGPAIHFLQTYNSGNFDILIGAKQLYSFEIFTMLGIGLAFQLPLAMLGLDYVGVLNAGTLIKHWRYALVIIAVIAAALPGPDLVTTGLEMVPLVFLYLLSIVMLKFLDRRLAAREAASDPARQRHLMLFDLRSRGRRRTVQGVYLGLAILMGGGLRAVRRGAGPASADCSTRSVAATRKTPSPTLPGREDRPASDPTRSGELGRLVGPRPGPLRGRRPGRQPDHRRLHGGWPSRAA